MTTNEIEKQLRFKSRKEIKDCVDTIIHQMQQFSRDHTNINRSGMNWFSKRYKPVKKYTSDPEPEDPFNHFDWKELSQLMVRNMEINWLDTMVEKKTKELLSKIDLLG